MSCTMKRRSLMKFPMTIQHSLTPQIRNTLAAFQFTGDDVYKLNPGILSGGEKGRVSLAKLMLSEANFLIPG